MNLAQALADAAGLGLPRLDLQLLLLHALGRTEDRAWLLAHDTDALDETSHSKFMALCRRRAGGEPLAYIVGHKEFFGLQLRVDPRVLVPRADTETLVEWALEVLEAWIPGQARDDSARVIDLGTGSGAIALAIKHAQPDVDMEAVDASAQALQVAADNAQRLGLDIGLRQASWLEGTQKRYDLILSNPPYVAEADPHLEGLRHEPLRALAAGPDGLEDIRAIVLQARHHLKPGGWLLLEHGYDQADAVAQLLAAAGFDGVASRRDLAGIERCSGGKWLELG